MAQPRLRYTIGVKGRPKKILSVSLQRRGDLILDLKPAESIRHGPGSAVIAGSIEFDRSTIHPSNESPEGNLITRTAPSSRGQGRMVQFTRAIKKNNKFAEVLTRLFPDISYDWDESRSPNNISLGSYDPAIETLLVGVFVGGEGREFLLGTDRGLCPDITVSQHVIGKFRVVVLTKILDFPSIAHGFTSFLQTFRPETIENDAHYKENEYIMNGFDEFYVYGQFLAAEVRFLDGCAALDKNMQFVSTVIPKQFE